MKITKKIFAIIIFAVHVLSWLLPELAFSATAESAKNKEQKIYSNATIEDEFADDSVMVVLKNEASLTYLDTQKIDFPEIKQKSIRNISQSKGKRVQAMIAERNNASLMERMFTEDPHAEEVSTYQQVLCIKLEERGKEKVLEAIALLEQREDVLYAGPDYEISLCSSEPNDPLYDYQWASEVIDLPEAWEMVPNPDKVLIGVLDTGIDASHPDLQGKVSSSLSRDFSSDDPESPTTDTNGHGTHVAGIIGAAAGNGTGGAGTHWNVEFVSLRVLDSFKGGKISDFCEALNYVVYELSNRGNESVFIPILSFSGRWKSATDDDVTALRIAITDYLKWGGLFICGAGNEDAYVKESGNNGDNPENEDPIFVYPASLDFDDYENAVIVVGASNQTDNGLWMGTSGSGSNYGQLAVDIFAPGDNILSCYSTSVCGGSSCTDDNHYSTGYHKMSGTSMATPYVTGVAALIKSIHPSKSAADIKTLIINNDDNKSWLTGNCVSGGRLNAYKALDASHTYIVWSTNSYGCISYRCTECEYVKTVHPQPLLTQPNDSSTHFHLCPGCGYQTEESHTWGGWANYDEFSHKRLCSVCGYIHLQKHSYLPGDTTRTCRICYRSDIIPGEGILSLPDEMVAGA